MIRSELLAGIPGFLFAMSSKTGGVSPPPMEMNLSFHVGDAEENVRRNRALFFGELGLREVDLAIPGQIHSTEVRLIRSPGHVEKCDGLVSDRSGVYLCVSVADCMPVVLVDRKKRTVAVLHAGWRGTAGGITGRALDIMAAEFRTNRSDIAAYLGPSARACCYEVGGDVASRFPDGAVERRDGKPFVHLDRANRLQLLAGGVSEGQIEQSSFCTVCNGTDLHSYRRDRARSGRMVAVAGFSPAPGRPA
ncbi:MAG: peptidoglycan editing factor PgeF [Ignavibacteria bacterium]|nr:peptidoglycan editing factor PgeF [Ignavibacteria bacterium]